MIIRTALAVALLAWAALLAPPVGAVRTAPVSPPPRAHPPQATEAAVGTAPHLPPGPHPSVPHAAHGRPEGPPPRTAGGEEDPGSERDGCCECKVSIVGAGFGGLYAAYRLLTDPRTPYRPHEICVWEKEEQVGGRARTLSDPHGDNVFPMRSRVSLGAHRWNPDNMPLVDSVIEKVLGLHSVCYSQTPDCVVDDVSYYDLRNGAYTGDLSSSEVPGFPYHLNPSEEWSDYDDEPNAIANMAGLFEAAWSPFLSDLADPDPAVRYPALRGATDAVRLYAVDGSLPSALPLVLSSGNLSSEMWSLWLTQIGEAFYFQQLHDYDTLRAVFDTLVEDATGSRLRVITDADGYELGFQWKDISLARLLAKRGVRIALRSEVASIKRAKGGRDLVLEFADGRTKPVASQKVILNVAVTQLLQLSHDSVIFTDPTSPKLRAMYNLVSPVPAAKAYGYYPDAWWPRMGLTNGEFSTNRQPNYWETRDSAVECEGLPPGAPSEAASAAGAVCKGWVNMAYPDGDYYKYFKFLQQGNPDPQVVVHRNTTDPTLAKWFWDFNYQFVQALCNATNATAEDCAGIPAPEIIAVGVWNQAWHDLLPNSRFVGGYINNATLLLSDNVYWANEANSRVQGWAEGSGWAAEQVLHFYFGFDRPSWLGNRFWYNNVIKNPLL